MWWLSISMPASFTLAAHQSIVAFILHMCVPTYKVTLVMLLSVKYSLLGNHPYIYVAVHHKCTLLSACVSFFSRHWRLSYLPWCLRTTVMWSQLPLVQGCLALLGSWTTVPPSLELWEFMKHSQVNWHHQSIAVFIPHVCAPTSSTRACLTEWKPGNYTCGHCLNSLTYHIFIVLS